MSLLDSLLGQAGQNIDVAGIAEKFGIDPATATQAIGALGAAHDPSNDTSDTVDAAAGNTGIDSDTLSGIAQELGGSEGLSQLNQVMQNHPQAESLFNQFCGNAGGGEGGGLMGLAKGFFGGE